MFGWSNAMNVLIEKEDPGQPKNNRLLLIIHLLFEAAGPKCF